MLPTIDLSSVGTAWVLGMLLKGTALLLAVAALAALLRRASASLRHLLWSAGIVTLLALPVLSVTVPWKVPVVTLDAPALVTPPEQTRTAETAGTAGTAEGTAGSRLIAPATETSPGIAAVPAVSVLSAVAAVWLAVALLLLARLAVGALILARLVRRATPLTTTDWNRPLLEAADRLALDRAPRLLMSDRLPMPFACGLVRPAIVLPSAAADWSDRRRRAVLFHELAHLRRLDLLVNALSQVVCAVWWFHPLAWVAARRLRIESERACDDLVLGVGTRPSEYADHLLQIVCGAARSRTPAIALPMAQRREFEGRMLAILERGLRRDPASRRHAAVLATFALALVVPLAALGTAVRADRADPAIPRDESREQEQPADPVSQEPPSGIPEPRPTPKPEPAPPAARPAPVASSSSAAQDTNRVISALMRALSDSVPSVREDAAYALAQREAKGAVPALGERLLNDRSDRVREMVAWSLGQLGSRQATTALTAALVRDASSDVRGTAAWALGQLEDPASVSALTQAVHEDKDEEVRGRAAWALGTIAARPAPAGLIAALRDPSPEVRVRAAWALGQIGDGDAAAPLAEALSDTGPDVRRAAFWALGQLPGDVAQNALIRALEDKDPEIRAKAARALGGSDGDPWPWPWPWPRHR